MKSTTRNSPQNGCAWLVLVASYFGALISALTLYMDGVLYIAYLHKYNQTESRTSLVGALHSGLFAILGPLVSIAMKKYTIRVTMVTGGFLMTIGCVSSTFVSEFDHLILTYGVITGAGVAFSYIPCSVVTAYYFEKRRNLVLALCSAVTGVGMLISAPMAFAILDKFGLQQTFLILGGLNAQYIVIGVLCRPSTVEMNSHCKNRRLSKSHDLLTTNQKVYLNISKTSLSCTKVRDSMYFKLIANVPFLLFVLSIMTWNATLSIYMLHFPNYMSIHGSGPEQISTALMCFSLCNTIGRFIGAISADRGWVDTLTLQAFMMGLTGVLTVTFPFYGVFKYTVYLFSVLMGLSIGIPTSLMAPTALRLVGMDAMTTALGLGFFFAGIGYFSAPPIAAALYTQTKTYTNSFIFSGCVILVGSMFTLVGSFLLSKKFKDLEVSVTSSDGSYTDGLQPSNRDPTTTDSADHVAAKQGLLDAQTPGSPL